MLKCSPEAFAKCPTHQYCGNSAADCDFTEGSNCDKFNRQVEDSPKTNADRIRAMSDEELAGFLADDDRACPPKWHNCRKHISECGGCWLEWLKQPAEEN